MIEKKKLSLTIQPQANEKLGEVLKTFLQQNSIAAFSYAEVDGGFTSECRKKTH